MSTHAKHFLALAATTALVCASTVARADRICVANQAAFGNGVIAAVNRDTHTVLGSFNPDGAKLGTNNGRAVQLFLGSNLVYYTELTNGFGPTDFVRVAPFNNGVGGADITHFANLVPGTGVHCCHAGTSWSISLRRSCPSACATGRIGPD